MEFDTEKYITFVAQEFSGTVIWTFPVDNVLATLGPVFSDLKSNLQKEQRDSRSDSDSTDSSDAGPVKKVRKTSSDSSTNAGTSSSSGSSGTEKSFTISDSEKMCATLEELKNYESHLGEEMSDTDKKSLLEVLTSFFRHSKHFSRTSKPDVLAAVTMLFPALKEKMLECFY